MTIHVYLRYGGYQQTYGNIARVVVDAEGNLRLYQYRALLFLRQVVFHPSHEWTGFDKVPK